MADKRISELTSASLPLEGTEEIAIVQSGVTKKTSVNNVSGTPTLEGYKETGTRAGGDLVVTIGDYDSSDNGSVLELDAANKTVSIKSDNQLNKVELSPNSLSFRFDNGYTAMSLEPLNTASTITRNLRLPDSSGTLATEDYVDNIFASLPSGTFTSTDGKTITVTNGLITNIV